MKKNQSGIALLILIRSSKRNALHCLRLYFFTWILVENSGSSSLLKLLKENLPIKTPNWSQLIWHEKYPKYMAQKNKAQIVILFALPLPILEILHISEFPIDSYVKIKSAILFLILWRSPRNLQPVFPHYQDSCCKFWLKWDKIWGRSSVFKCLVPYVPGCGKK